MGINLPRLLPSKRQLAASAALDGQIPCCAFAGVLLRYVPLTANRITGIVSRGGSIHAKVPLLSVAMLSCVILHCVADLRGGFLVPVFMIRLLWLRSCACWSTRRISHTSECLHLGSCPLMLLAHDADSCAY